MEHPGWAESRRLRPARAASPTSRPCTPSLRAGRAASTTTSWQSACRACGVAAAPVLNVADLLSNPHYKARKTFIEIEHPLGFKETVYGNYVKTTRARARVCARAGDGPGQRARLSRSARDFRGALSRADRAEDHLLTAALRRTARHQRAEHARKDRRTWAPSRAKACIVGIGNTPYRRGTEGPVDTPLRIELEACEAAIADAGLRPSDIDGILPFYGLSIAEVLAVNLGVEDLKYQATSHVGGAGRGHRSPTRPWRSTRGSRATC